MVSANTFYKSRYAALVGMTPIVHCCWHVVNNNVLGDISWRGRTVSDFHARRLQRNSGVMALKSEPSFRRHLPEERRQSILTAAAELFSSVPYEQVSVADIAASAGIARGLVNHYFGTKRQLFLEVVRQASTVPTEAVESLPAGDVGTRIEASVDWFLDNLQRNGRSWLHAMGTQGIGRDLELESILAEAEDESVERVIEAVGLNDVTDIALLRALIRPFGQLARAAGREWLFKQSLSRHQARILLITTLSAIVTQTYPQMTHSSRSQARRAKRSG